MSFLPLPSPPSSSPLSDPVPTAPAFAAPRISFVSLGCPKALVDSERIITQLRAEGYDLAKSHAGADLVIVNTCGFLDSAQAESLEAIGEALSEVNGKVIVTGCMGARAGKAITSNDFPMCSRSPARKQYESVVSTRFISRGTAAARSAPRRSGASPKASSSRPRHYAYLKISEGCNNQLHVLHHTSKLRGRSCLTARQPTCCARPSAS